MLRLTPKELTVVRDAGTEGWGDRLTTRLLLVLVGLTGAGKSTTVERLVQGFPIAAMLPDRRALTDELILPMMTGNPEPVSDRLERFRLTAAFKERHSGGMGDVLQWLALPPGVPAGPILFDGLRGEAEVAAASTLPQARFLVLQCAPEERLWRLCGRNDPFDRTAAGVSDPAAAGADAMRATLVDRGFDALVSDDVLDQVARALGERGVDPDMVSRGAAIICEEARHYDPDAAAAALTRLAGKRTLVVDTVANRPEEVCARVAAAWPELSGVV